MNNPIYFYHIPKTAGSTVNCFLEEQFGPLMYKQYTIDQYCNTPPTDSYFLYSGHLYYFLEHIQERKLRKFTFLRDPIDRAISHYFHVIRDSNHYLHSIALELGSLENYLRDPRTQPTVSNFMTRCFSRQAQAQLLIRNLDCSRFNRQAYVECNSESIFSTSTALDDAINYINEFEAIGITSQMTESLEFICDVFEIPSPDSIAPYSTNISTSRIRTKDIHPEIHQELISLNTNDIALYEHAVGLFSQQREIHKRKSITFQKTISYSQNGEDIVLKRALQNVKSGRYIDIGAHHPEIHSATNLFYQNGWSGTNVEPSKEHATLLRQYRPRDTTIEAAVSMVNGTVALHEIPDTGLSTINQDYSSIYKKLGFHSSVNSVRSLTLNDVFETHGNGDIHFLKIDAEGSELEIIRSGDFTSWRPWIILVETRNPFSGESTHDSIASWITAKNYVSALQDGINSYFVAVEHRELICELLWPANVFDNYINIANFERERNIRKLRLENHKLNRQLQSQKQLDAHISNLEQWAKSAEEYAKSLETELKKTKLSWK